MTLLSWEELAHKEVKPIPFLIDPYIPKESIILLYGDTSIGKSPLTWEMARAVGGGRSFFGLPSHQGRVLYINTDTPDVVEIPRLQMVPSCENVWFYWTNPLSAPFIPRAKIDELKRLGEELSPDVVFLNTLRKMHGQDDRDSKAPVLIYSFFQSIFPTSSLVFVHHIRKSPIDPKVKENDREAFSGSKHWLDDAQVGLHLSRFKNDGNGGGNLRLFHVKSQASEVIKPLPLHLHKNGSTLTSPLYDELLMAYSLLNEGGMGKGEIDDRVGKAFNISTSTAKRRRLLVEKGRFPGSRTFLSGEEDGEEE